MNITNHEIILKCLKKQRTKMCGVINDGNEKSIYCQTPEAAEVCYKNSFEELFVTFNIFNTYSGFWRK